VLFGACAQQGIGDLEAEGGTETGGYVGDIFVVGDGTSSGEEGLSIGLSGLL